MQLTTIANRHGFSIVSSETVPEISGEAIVMQHDFSHARLLYLLTEDNNKSFSIAFKTPPKDDTGVFHILEHSVLCGSKKFPVKEPFVNLLKGSMQTFLNAMTFPDKTVYPVASTNEKDLFNLMDVYLDAVFHPRIFDKKEIFEQEGWHFEVVNKKTGQPITEEELATLDSSDCSIVHNGVVYNEMRGALSDPNSVLYDKLQATLFPDTTYSFESGGIPGSIPELSYEEYLDEHRRHYRPSNSYITFYGNMDIDHALQFLDEEYLTPVSKEIETLDKKRSEDGLESLSPRNINYQEPICSSQNVYYMKTDETNACAGLGYVVPSTHEEAVAIDILNDALLGSNEAPLKHALIEADIADDFLPYMSESMIQPFIALMAVGLHENGADRFEETFTSACEKILADGLNLNLIEASLSRAEFVVRERDYGVADGVALAIGSLSGWLYDDNDAVSYLRYNDIFKNLRQKLHEGYFEHLLRSIFLENNHRTFVEIRPGNNPEAEMEAKRLEEITHNATRDDLVNLTREVNRLRISQITPDSEEELATLPYLTREDIEEAPRETEPTIEHGDITCIQHHFNTNGIVYATHHFDLAHKITFDELPYIAILGLVLGKLDTKKHTAAQLDTLVQSQLGNLNFGTKIYPDAHNFNEFKVFFSVDASALNTKIESLVNIPYEILFDTQFDQVDKIKNILEQQRFFLEQSFAASGNRHATARVRSYCAKDGLIDDALHNIEFYLFIKDLLANFDEKSAELTCKLEELQNIFTSDNLTLSIAASEEDYQRYRTIHPKIDSSSTPSKDLMSSIPEPVVKNEAFIVSSDVTYTALGCNWHILEPEYKGVWMVASRAATLDHLWNEVRVKGGAYGVSFSIKNNGLVSFSSYRDPRIDETIDRFKQTATWLAKFCPSEQDMDGFIVSSVAGLDAPLKPRQIINKYNARYFSNRSKESDTRLRNELIESRVEDVQKCSELLTKVLDKNTYCIFGNRDIINDAQIPLTVVDILTATKDVN